MQSPSLKYLQNKNQDFYMFFQEAATLYYKILTPSGWSQPQILAEKTGPMFSVSYYENQVFVLYSTSEGTLMLAKTTDFARWDKKQLYSDKKDFSRTKFFILPEQNSFHMIYHMPTENTNIHSLIYASFHNGQWENSYQVDRFMPFSGEAFLASRVSNNHIILYYRTARNVISAREMLLTPTSMGSINPIIQTSYPCTDISVINDAQRIHLLYIVKGMFRSQVVYQYKQSASISTPRVIWEDVSCENCLVYQENGKLKLMWTAAGQAYLCTSENNGGSFFTVEKYTAPFPRSIAKGELIQVNVQGAPIKASEGFGDSKNGYALALFGQEKVLQPTKAPVSAPTTPDNNTRFANTEVHQNMSQGNLVLESQKQQIEELTRLLSQRSEEVSQVNARWKEQTTKLEQQTLSLKQSLSTKQQENYSLKKSLEDLEQRLYAAESHSSNNENFEEESSE